MIRVRPSFYDAFSCKASACRHSCCVGWEIDVDADTRELYAAVEGGFGRELREKISSDAEPHFLLGADERCPFLREDGLCRIILELGEEALCDVCAEHPRFYNVFPGREEAGLGLCCEETVRLLTEGEPFTLIEEDDGEDEERDPWVERLAILRREIDALLRRGSGAFECRLADAFSLFDAQPPLFDPAEWAAFLLTLERMDERWTFALQTLSRLTGAAWRKLLDDERYERIFRYLLYRHLIAAEGREEARKLLAFCAVGTMTVCALDAAEPEARDEHLRLWSAEIEYSDENVRRICEKL